MERKNGISLIVLVITILVMIILAGTVIVSLQESNPINKAKEASIRENISHLRQGIVQHVTLVNEALDVNNEFFKFTDETKVLGAGEYAEYYLLKPGDTKITALGVTDETAEGTPLKDVIGASPELINGKIYVNKKGNSLFVLTNKQELIALRFTEDEIKNRTIKDNIMAAASSELK